MTGSLGNRRVLAPTCAAIDIGTNTLLTLVGRRGRDGALERLADLATITRLGEGVDRTRVLVPEAMDRAIAALEAFVATARSLGAVRIAAVATSAVRDATNREVFLARARAIAGDDVRVIDGEREAELTFAGATDGTPIAAQAPVLAFDVGGGSTEIVAGLAGSPSRSRVSVNIGSVRLTERLLAHDPPSAEDLARVRDAIAQALAHVAPPDAPHTLVGLAATVTTVAAMARGIASLDGASVRGTVLTRDEVDRVAALLASTPLAQRRSLAGLDPRRADVIIAGVEIVRAVMRWASSSTLMVSDGGVRVGLMHELVREIAR